MKGGPIIKKEKSEETLKQKFLQWISELPEKDWQFLWENDRKERVLAYYKKRSEKDIAEEIGIICNIYLIKWPTDDKYDKVAKLLKMAKDSPFSVYAFQYVLGCLIDYWFYGPEGQKLKEALQHHEVID